MAFTRPYGLKFPILKIKRTRCLRPGRIWPAQNRAYPSYPVSARQLTPRHKLIGSLPATHAVQLTFFRRRLSSQSWSPAFSWKYFSTQDTVLVFLFQYFFLFHTDIVIYHISSIFRVTHKTQFQVFRFWNIRERNSPDNYARVSITLR